MIEWSVKDPIKSCTVFSNTIFSTYNVLYKRDLLCFFWVGMPRFTYRKTPYIRRTLVGNKIVDHSDVVGASPVGAAPTTSSFST